MSGPRCATFRSETCENTNDEVCGVYIYIYVSMFPYICISRHERYRFSEQECVDVGKFFLT
jgi:hypothetical protein